MHLTALWKAGISRIAQPFYPGGQSGKAAFQLVPWLVFSLCFVIFASDLGKPSENALKKAQSLKNKRNSHLRRP